MKTCSSCKDPPPTVSAGGVWTLERIAAQFGEYAVRPMPSKEVTDYLSTEKGSRRRSKEVNEYLRSMKNSQNASAPLPYVFERDFGGTDGVSHHGPVCCGARYLT